MKRDLPSVDIPQFLVSTPRFSAITPLRRSIGYPQMRNREEAKFREVRLIILRATSHPSRLRGKTL
ncbi:MAG: hypothetical protein ABSH08_14530 [Tepidisphaeraceae bacterium]|jgi:hypothetical protein